MGGRALTKAEFVKLARANHGQAYEYHQTVYTSSQAKVTITCPTHGDWSMIACQHVRKTQFQGCPKCSKLQKAAKIAAKPTKKVKLTPTRTAGKRRGPPSLTTAEWIVKAKAVHGDTFDYSKVNYTHSQKNVTIQCRLHGAWAANPNNHINRKSGCPVCAGRLCRDLSIFIKRAKTVHGSKYDYHLVSSNFTTADDDAAISCPKHGVFYQTMVAHLHGNGCPDCGDIQTGVKQRGIKKRKMKVVTIK